MKRLTRRDEHCNADIIGVNSADLQLHLDFNGLNMVTNALNKLAAYEGIGLEPKEIPKLKAENALLRKVEEAGEIMWGDAICHRCESQVCRGCSAHDFKKALSEYLDWREGQELDKEGER